MTTPAPDRRPMHPRLLLDEPRFSAEQCDARFAAMLVNDEVDLTATLPDEIIVDYSQEQFAQCYRLCRQIWRERVTRKTLIDIVRKIYRHRKLNSEDQLVFKHVRAKIKHLRFAYVNFDEKHRCPVLFQWMTAIMGYLQDAVKNNQNAIMGRAAILVRSFLTKFSYFFISKEIDRFQPCTVESFKKYIANEINFIQLNLIKDKVTSKEFHEVRKIIGRQVSLYDNLKVLYPSPYHHEVSKYLRTINGLMGALHDELITEKFKNDQNYYNDTFEIPIEIKQRLIALVARYK